MTERPPALDPLTLPLQGSRLIEASAGTGKTWTIAALYVRLVIGHGCAPQPPSQILVMTFTRAATRELSDRIRARLVQAAAHFRGEAVTRPGEAPDDFLVALLKALPDAAARQQAAWRLAMAAEAMDDAAVHTIDAWCQRMLREHAFDSGSLFDEELQAQEAALRQQAVRDYWRQQVYPLQGDPLAAVLGFWKDVDALAASVAPLLERPLPADAGSGRLDEALARGQALVQAELQALKSGWRERADEMLRWFEAYWADPACAAAKVVSSLTNIRNWVGHLQNWVDAPEMVSPKVTGTSKDNFSGIKLRRTLRDARIQREVPACFDAFDDLLAALKSPPSPLPTLRLHAAAHIQQRLQQAKASAGTFGFADLLDRLDQALDDGQGDPSGPTSTDESGPGVAAERAERRERAHRLRQRILEQYPVALVDEFQDTSPVQLRIFDRLYRIADNDPARTLLLIGDPKQAIYGFRGADIYSYLRARVATAGRHHVLDTNRRSTVALVRAVNGLFLQAEQRPGGAFEFGGVDAQTGASASPLPFVDVGAAGRPERLQTARGEHPPLTLCVDATPRKRDDSLPLFAALCAERIVDLLNDPLAGFEERGRPWRRLRPADLAVLVRTAREADAVRLALRRRAVASVYLSDRDSVFETLEAADVLRLLQSVAEPRDVRLARAALATTLLGRSLDELHALATDDLLFDREGETLQRLHGVWKSQGVLSMLRRALHAWGLPARWLADASGTVSGERRLTNVLHLAELLETASAEVEGEAALIRWLARQITDAQAGQGGGDELILRLESDADLVQVVTVHKSKGLEYPLVFLPFPAQVRDIPRGRSDVLWLPDGRGGRTLVLSPSPEQRAQEEHERLREDLRLLYVALTRARHALWVGVAALHSGTARVFTWHRSALGCLVAGPQDQGVDRFLPELLALAEREGLQLDLLPPDPPEGGPVRPPVTRLAPREAAPALVPAPVYSASFDRLWSIASYSALVRDALHPGTSTSAPAADSNGAPVLPMLREDEPEAAEQGAETAPGSVPTAEGAAGPGVHARGRAVADRPWHRFPRGAYAGHFLHGQLEWLAGERFALEDSTGLQQALHRRCERQGWGHRADDVVAWLRAVCAAPMPAVGAALSGLDRVVPELEFWYPSDGLDAGRLDALCRQHLWPDRPRPALPPRTLAGLLMGFADLVFEHQGRYWVLDYKSNALGPDDASYTVGAMDQAMLAHRYDVQAVLYLLALHRLLRTRLGPAYVPARHLGGAVYLFLRGVQGPQAGCCHIAPPLALIETLDAMLPVARSPALMPGPAGRRAVT